MQGNTKIMQGSGETRNGNGNRMETELEMEMGKALYSIEILRPSEIVSDTIIMG